MKQPLLLTPAFLSLAALSGCGIFQQDPNALRAHALTQRQLDPDQYRARQISFEDESENDSLGLDDLSPTTVGQQVRNLAGVGPNPTLSRELFGEAKASYQEAAATQGPNRGELFLKAAEQYAEAAKRWPDSSLSQDAYFWAGQAYFFADRYPQANQQFEILLKKFPNSKYLDQVEARRFSIAMFWLELNDVAPEAFYAFNMWDKARPWRDSYGNALRIMDKIRIDDPTGKLADDATLAAANAYFASGDYMKADEYYTDLRKTFPSSEHQFVAHFLGMQAKIRSYQGPSYSGNALDEAEKLILQMRRQFPREANQDKNREFLNRAFAEVRFNKAERKWSRATYHDRRREYRAAALFYNTLLSEFSDTPFATRAQERLAQISDKPPVPPQKLSWLVKAFPDDEADLPRMVNNPEGVQRR